MKEENKTMLYVWLPEYEILYGPYEDEMEAYWKRNDLYMRYCEVPIITDKRPDVNY